MDHMDFTNLNSTQNVYAEIEEVLKDLEGYENVSVEELQEQLAQEKAKLQNYKTIYEEKLAKGEVLKAKKGQREKEREAQEKLEAEELQNKIISVNTKMDLRKLDHEAKMSELRATLAELERSQTPPTEESVTLNQQAVDLMEENLKLKELLASVNSQVDLKDFEILEQNLVATSLETELTELNRELELEKQTLKEMKEYNKDKENELAILHMQLNQMSDQPLNGVKPSLYSEVLNKTSALSNKYKTLKNVYIKNKKKLANKNAEIEKCKSESVMMSSFSNEKKNLREELKKQQERRIEDLKHSITDLEVKIEKASNIKPVTIGVRNLSDIKFQSQDAEREVKRCEREINTILQTKLPLERRLFSVDRELIQAKKELKQLIFKNAECEENIEKVKNEKQAFDGQTASRKVRFEEDVKYIKEDIFTE